MAAVQRSASGPPCSALARAAHEPMPGTAPEADVWIAVEHPAGWGEASLARSAAGVRVIMARGPRRASAGVAADEEVPGLVRCAPSLAALLLG